MESVGERLSAQELRAWSGFLTTHSRLVRELDEDLRATHGMPLSTFDVLIQLSRAPDERLRMRDLADAIVLSRSGLTRLVDRLVSEGLVRRERCGDDARGWWAVLTPEGREALEKATPTHLEGVRRRFLSVLEPGDQELLGNVWERIQT